MQYVLIVIWATINMILVFQSSPPIFYQLTSIQEVPNCKHVKTNVTSLVAYTQYWGRFKKKTPETLPSV